MIQTSRSISVVVPCYLDGGTVRELHRRVTEVLQAAAPNYEIIIVNDASPDRAEEILREMAQQDRRLVVINHSRNFGSQNAFLSGMKVSRGEAVVLMDGDLQDPPALIPAFIEKWLQGHDVVYGVRVKRCETRFRQVAYKVFYRVFRNLANIAIPVDAGDFGLMDRRVVNLLVDEFPERLAFLRGLRAFTGFRQTGVEYVREPRYDGRTTNSFLSNIRWAKLAIFSFSHKPLEYISFIAFYSVLITGFAAAWYLMAYFQSGRHAPSGFMTLLLLGLFLGSVQLACLSILAEYLRHMYEELKRRPRYIVRDMIDRRGEPGASATERKSELTLAETP